MSAYKREHDALFQQMEQRLRELDHQYQTGKFTFTEDELAAHIQKLATRELSGTPSPREKALIKQVRELVESEDTKVRMLDDHGEEHEFSYATVRELGIENRVIEAPYLVITHMRANGKTVHPFVRTLGGPGSGGARPGAGRPRTGRKSRVKGTGNPGGGRYPKGSGDRPRHEDGSQDRDVDQAFSAVKSGSTRMTKGRTKVTKNDRGVMTEKTISKGKEVQYGTKKEGSGYFHKGEEAAAERFYKERYAGEDSRSQQDFRDAFAKDNPYDVYTSTQQNTYTGKDTNKINGLEGTQIGGSGSARNIVEADMITTNAEREAFRQIVRENPELNKELMSRQRVINKELRLKEAEIQERLEVSKLSYSQKVKEAAATEKRALERIRELEVETENAYAEKLGIHSDAVYVPPQLRDSYYDDRNYSDREEYDKDGYYNTDDYMDEGRYEDRDRDYEAPAPKEQRVLATPATRCAFDKKSRIITAQQW